MSSLILRRAAVVLLASGLLAGCGKLSGVSRARAAREAVISSAARGPRVRVVRSRQSPRTPFRLDLEADMLDDELCDVSLRLRASPGGGAAIEFVLPPGAEAIEGELARSCPLLPGATREERLLVRVPAAGHHLLAVAATLNGRRAEAFLEFGDPPPAAERGLRTRTGGGGDQVLRIGPEELGR